MRDFQSASRALLAPIARPVLKFRPFVQQAPTQRRELLHVSNVLLDIAAPKEIHIQFTAEPALSANLGQVNAQTATPATIARCVRLNS